MAEEGTVTPAEGAEGSLEHFESLLRAAYAEREEVRERQTRELQVVDDAVYKTGLEYMRLKHRLYPGFVVEIDKPAGKLPRFIVQRPFTWNDNLLGLSVNMSFWGWRVLKGDEASAHLTRVSLYYRAPKFVAESFEAAYGKPLPEKQQRLVDLALKGPPWQQGLAHRNVE